MAYIINKFSGEQLVVLEDGTLDTSTSIGLLGRNYTGYGETQNENFLFLLENFANESPPSRPITGQAWYNTVIGSLNVYNGSVWAPVGSATVSNSQPTGFEGAIWYKDSTDQLFVFDSGFWKLIGPEALEGYATTQVRAREIVDTVDVSHAVVEILVDGTTFVICADEAFTIDASNLVSGFANLQAGTNFSTARPAVGSLIGNASSASRLEPGRTINGTYFDGQTNVTITANTANVLSKGAYITGANFNGSAATTWSVDASASNIIGKVVARDSAGDFSAGTITADLVGSVTGNVTAATGTSTFARVEANEFVGATLSGNAFTSSKLQTARTINGVLFDGTTDITVPTAAANLTGAALAANVLNSALVTVGRLAGVSTTDAGVTVGESNEIQLSVLAGAPTLAITNGLGLAITINDAAQAGGEASFEFISSAVALAAGGTSDPAFVGDTNSKCNIGLPGRKFGTVHADVFSGIATTAQYADLAEVYVADAEYAAGTVLEFGGEFEVTLATDGTNRLAGVVSTNPAYLMNSQCAGKYTAAVALQGRVPCQVQGTIRKGDMLISAGNGYARKAINLVMGTVIGKALADFDGTSGTIEVAIGRV